ncbi:LysR family transcriptional regulator [Litoreibacter albidus]|uniref:LysR family transcriptional regulator n=1 Tax=Litoreibacter albidus TaxID=670155 RepID=UPI003735E112
MTDAADIRRLPPLKALRALEAIHLTGSVTRAAQQLRVSHSAISHQVRILEDWSTTPLFSRSGRTTVLTEAGRSLAMTAHRAFDEVRHEIDRLPLRQVDPVTVATLPLLATEVILPNLTAFTEKEPNVRLHVSLALSDRPMMHTPDLQILFVRRAAVLASDVTLFAGDAIPVCAPALVKRTGQSPEALLEAGPHIHDEDLRMWPTWVEQHRRGIQKLLGDEATMILLEGSLLIHEAVAQGLGVGFVRRAMSADKLASGELLACSEEAIDFDWVYVLRVAADRADDPQVQLVAKWLRRICTQRS